MTDYGSRIAAGAVLLLIAAAVFRGVPMWTTWRDAVASETLASSALLHMETGQLERLPEMLDTTEVRIARIRKQGSVLVLSDSAESPESAVVARMTERARVHNVRIDSIAPIRHGTRVVTGAAGDGSRSSTVLTVGIEVMATTDVRGLLDLLRSLEESASPLRPGRVSITPDDVYVQDTHPESIRVTIAVEAVVLVRSDSGRTEP